MKTQNSGPELIIIRPEDIKKQWAGGMLSKSDIQPFFCRQVTVRASQTLGS